MKIKIVKKGTRTATAPAVCPWYVDVPWEPGKQ
jgi:hypothetical protein